MIALINLNIILSSFFCYLLYHAIKEKFTFKSDIKYRAEKLVVRIHQNISTLWYILKSYYFFPSLENLGLPRWLSWERLCLQCRRPRFDSWVGKIPWRRDRLPTPVFLCFPCGLVGKEFSCNMEDLGLIPWLGRSPGEGKGYPLQYSGLENSMNCIVYGVAESDEQQLSNFHFHFFGKSEREAKIQQEQYTMCKKGERNTHCSDLWFIKVCSCKRRKYQKLKEWSKVQLHGFTQS